MPLTPQQIQALDSHFGYVAPAAQPIPVPQPNPNYNPKAEQVYAEKMAAERAKADSKPPQNEAELAAQVAEIENAGRAINQAKGMIGGDNWYEAGYVGDKLKETPGTDAYALQKQLDQIRSNVALAKLMEMKQNSPTGASGFGALSEGELRLLETNQGALDLGQGEGRLKSKLNDVYGNYDRIYGQLTGGKKLRADDPLGIR